ncbi:copper-binding protein [Maritimibacter sp. 55A14]|uniref:copper chaperone PCu(A)C n=1 Tax=Maritimibacter sp. 55A14 TaxID=2174844 RepID=UPI000D620215|nr:copper chaperone PCu(A)C [Maritimibacter sp. 55A14]PWE32025.1 copper-binding protein [Maritimibacter sp. 55A14]
MIRPLHVAAVLAAGFFSMPALAGDIAISDAYARAATPTAKTGAAFMTIANSGSEPDRLIGVTTEAAAKAELHTHTQTSDGMMQMRAVEDGFAIPAGGMHMLARGGDHVMLMGLTAPLRHGDEIEMKLRFEKAGDIAVTIPVDLERMPEHGAGMEHGKAD